MDAKKSTGFKLSVATLAIMNVTAVVSLRGLPAEAVYGPSSAFYYLFAAIVFLIPTSLVAAELAAMFADKQGGVFRWVGEAYGARTGFLAIWLQWIESTIWYPTVLTFGAVSIAFIGMNDVHDAVLASNGVRAGSTLTLAQALRNIVKFTDHPVQDVIPLMTINPAKALRMDDRKGTLEAGKDADMVLLDDELNVVMTVGLGRVLYTA